MVAFAPLSHWLPQDDLLLKNAVEAGASLESLAKGAVQFSRRFTVRELQNRWYSILYDPAVAEEASVRMIESERSVSTTQSKKIENNKEAKGISGKRKAESVRQCYYAMRKRISNEPFYSMDLNFLGGPCFGNAGNGPTSADGLTGDQVSTYDGIQEPNFGVENGSLVEHGMNGATSPTDDFSAAALFNGFCDHDHISLGQSNQVQDICPPCDNNGLDPSKEFQVSDLLEPADLEAQHCHMFGHTNDKEVILSSGSGCQVFNSSASGCVTSLQGVGYSSPVANVSDLGTADRVSASTLHDVCFADNGPHAADDLQISDGIDSPNRSKRRGGDVHLKSELKDQTTCGNMMDSPPNAEEHFSDQVTCDNLEDIALNTEEYFEQLSNSLLSFTPEDELLLMDVDGKEIMDKSYIDLSSLLLDFPDESDMQSLGLSEASVVPQECFDIPSAAHDGRSGDEEQYHCGVRQLDWSAEAQKLSSALTVNPMFPELRNGVICCTLNTEDPEIPDNDDVFLPIWMPSTSISLIGNSKLNEVCYPMPLSVKEFSHNHKPTDRIMMKGESSDYSEFDIPNQMTKSRLPSEMGPNHHLNNNGLRFELPCSDVPHMLRKMGTSECLNHANKTDITPGSLKENLTQVEQAEGLIDNSGASHFQKQTEDLDTLLTFQKNAVVCKQEADCTSADQKDDVIHAGLCSSIKTVPKQSLNSTLSDQEEFSPESDSDMPYFSDVEAMILDMDLSPDDPNIYHSRGVLRYQHESARRTIIRLEQAAEGFTQRSFAVQGAFAVLYGHRSKHFIKKPEVLLGRGTEDVKVDIDLGREAQASKISRRQATLKLESDGSFHLRNHGKFSIFVNGKEVGPERTISLISGCLIEICNVFEELADKGNNICFRDE